MGGRAEKKERTAVVDEKNTEKATPRKDGDEALGIAQQGRIHVSPEDDKRLLRLIDWHLMPLMCILYGIQFLDKTTLSYASIMGLRQDTNINGQQYSNISSAFYIGYIIWEFPAARMLQYFPLAKYTGANMVIWGTILACLAATRNYSGLFAVRFFLGVILPLSERVSFQGMFEASVTPGFALFVSRFYRVDEQGSRTAIWFSFNGFGIIVGGLTAYGLAKADAAGKLAIAGWRLIFIIFGCVTLALGIVFVLFIPDSPLNAKWLTEEDKRMVIERRRVNNQGIGNKQFKKEQIKEALMDPIVWLFFLYAILADIPNGGVTSFFSIVIRDLGFTAEESLLYGSPGGAFEVFSILIFLWLGDRYKMRIFFGCVSLAITLAGVIMLYALPIDQPWARLGGYWMYNCSATPFVVILSLIASNISGYTKKNFVAAVFLVGYCIGNLIGPQTFTARSAPRYTGAFITIIVCYCLCFCLLFAIWAINVRRNRKRDKFMASSEYVHQPDQDLLDLTDLQNPEFRYVS